MTTLEDIAIRLDRIEAKLPDSSPWIRGDQEAAEYAGYRPKKAFVTWANARLIAALKKIQSLTASDAPVEIVLGTIHDVATGAIHKTKGKA